MEVNSSSVQKEVSHRSYIICIANENTAIKGHREFYIYLVISWFTEMKSGQSYHASDHKKTSLLLIMSVVYDFGKCLFLVQKICFSCLYRLGYYIYIHIFSIIWFIYICTLINLKDYHHVSKSDIIVGKFILFRVKNSVLMQVHVEHICILIWFWLFDMVIE